MSETITVLRTQDILDKLSSRVSKPNAKLLLDSAKIRSGIKVTDDVYLKRGDARAICMQLINQGGPSFHVGQAFYKEHLM